MSDSAGLRVIGGLAALEAAVGAELGLGEWRVVAQDRIDAFAEATDDRQWLHVDPSRAAAGPYGGTIAHGYLTLSLLPELAASAFRVDGVAARVNYGLERVRFPAVVRPGSRIRTRAALLAVERVAGGLRAVIRHTVELEGSAKPACVAETVTLYLEVAS